MVSTRHARANNHRVEGYNPKKPNNNVLYLDANNLYGWAMSEALPTGGFQWVEDCKQLAKNIKDHPADDPVGYILEVDLEYPTELHKAHNTYPLAPTGVAPTEVKKLVPNLHNKERYVLHYRNLQLYASLGMRLKKVHRALRFDQSPWMEPYIRMNTELRKKATNAFEKDLYKLMNNSVFGKTMENLRRRVDVKLVRANEEDKLRRLVASPAFARANGQGVLHRQQHGEVHLILFGATALHRQRAVLVGIARQASRGEHARGLPYYRAVRAGRRKTQAGSAEGRIPL